MATTLATVYNRALSELGILGRGQTATAEDTADITKAYDEVYAWLDRKGWVEWDSADDVPDEFVQPIVALMAKSRLNKYNVDIERRNQILSDAADARFIITDLVAAPKTGTTEIVEF